MKKLILIVKAVVLGSVLLAQPGSGIVGVSGSGVLDGSVLYSNTATSRIIPYTNLEERNVTWQKRVWQKIDLIQKRNFPLYYPEEPTISQLSLWDVIKFGIEQEQSITPYAIISSNENDTRFDDDGEFLYPIKPKNGTSMILLIKLR